MALPFIAGLALGSVAMLAFTKKNTLQKELTLGTQKAKELANKGLTQSKKVIKNVKSMANRAEYAMLDSSDSSENTKRGRKAKTQNGEKKSTVTTGKRRGRPRLANAKTAQTVENLEATNSESVVFEAPALFQES